MEYYNRFIIIASENIKVLFMELKNDWYYEIVSWTHIPLLIVIHGSCIDNRNFLGLDIAQPGL